MGDSQGFEVLAAILCSRDRVSTRCLAAWSLGETRTAAAAEALVRALGDKLTAESVRDALTKIGQPAVKPLLSVLRDGSGLKDPESHAAAAALTRIGTPAVGALVRSLEDGSEQERRWAPLILSQIGDQRAVGPLIAILDDDDPGVRIAAAHALETMAPGTSYYRCSRCGKGFQLSITMGAKTTVMRCRSCGLSVCESCGEWDEVKGSTCARCGATALWEKQLTVPL
jgi:DNA-directed RNA polymerase subunit RPC12/RpoP